MKRVILESPYAGRTPALLARNTRYVRAAMRTCLLREQAPFASHAFYTLPGVLDDGDPVERKLGMEAGWAWMRVLDPNISVVVCTDLGISDGMRAGIDNAKSWGRQVEMLSLGAAWADGGESLAYPTHLDIETEAQEAFKALGIAGDQDGGMGLGDNQRGAVRDALTKAYEKGRLAGLGGP